jgi:hypothetical protein
MDLLNQLSRQPLFQLLGAIIVLLTAEWHPVYGIVAFIAWAAWVWAGSRPRGRRIF